MRLAYFSPLGPQHSGIADYSEELLPYLAEGAEITLFVDGFQPVNGNVISQFPVVDYRNHPEVLQQLDRFDAVVYHMGNDHRYHSGILKVMQEWPGVVVLHDFAFQEFFLGLARERREPSIYLDEVEFCYGQRARDEAADALKRGAAPSIVSQPLEFPLNNRIVKPAEGVIVHSEWARQRLDFMVPGVPVVRIPMPLEFDDGEPAGTANDEVRIASFGLITPGKGIEMALRALRKLKATHRFRYSLVGEANSFYNVRELIRREGMDGVVEITGHLTLAEFKQRIAQTDIALNIRERTVGETSASLCRLLAGGVCSVVADIAWYSELPNDCVVKVPLDSSADELLHAYLERLIEDQVLRDQIGENARRFAQVEHAAGRGATAYLDFIREVINRRIHRDAVFAVSEELSQLGIKSSDQILLQQIAKDVSELVPAGDRFAPVTAAAERPAPELGAASANGNHHAQPARSVSGRTASVAGIDYKQAAREYLSRLSDERRHHLRTKPFYNLANKPAKYRRDGMEEDMHRHFCDFANMAVTLALPAGSSILDVGCGSGWLSEYFARLGYVVKGIDISPDLIQMSRERVERVPYGADHETPLRCSFAVHDVELASLEEKFDAVICYDSLHHFEDERAVMRHLAEMLDVGGSLFILEGERPPADSTAEAELRAVMNEFQTLESPFDHAYLRRLLDENGLAIVGDYVSVNGLFEREVIEDDRLPLRTVATTYHYLACKKVAVGQVASTVPDSRRPGVLQARFELLDQPAFEVSPGEPIPFEVEVTNTGDTLWLASHDPRTGIVMPAVRIYDEKGTLLNEVHGEPILPRAVTPGETINLRFSPIAPGYFGKYVLKVDLVAQHICWFEQAGSTPLLINFEVR